MSRVELHCLRRCLFCFIFCWGAKNSRIYWAIVLSLVVVGVSKRSGERKLGDVLRVSSSLFVLTFFRHFISKHPTTTHSVGFKKFKVNEHVQNVTTITTRVRHIRKIKQKIKKKQQRQLIENKSVSCSCVCVFLILLSLKTLPTSHAS